MIRDDLMKIKLAGVIEESVVDGPGIRFVIFTQGCPHKCVGCHNPETHDFDGGFSADTDKIYQKILNTPLVKGVTFSGGEPFAQPEALCTLARKLKEKNYHIMCYTGYTFEQLLKMSEINSYILDLLNFIDILVDGKFVLEQRNLLLKFRGSENQRIIDCQKSLTKLSPVIIEL